MASVSEMLRRLADKGLVEHTPYAAVKLTPKGERAAREVKNRHIVLQQFLMTRFAAEADLLANCSSPA